MKADLWWDVALWPYGRAAAEQVARPGAAARIWSSESQHNPNRNQSAVRAYSFRLFSAGWGGRGDREEERKKNYREVIKPATRIRAAIVLSCITYLTVAHWELLISCYWEQMTDLRLAQSADMIIILSSANKKGGFRMHLPCTTLSSARPQARWSGWGAVAANKSWCLKARDFC